MSTEYSPSSTTPGLVLAESLRRLRILSLNLDVYGSEEDAITLHEIIGELEGTCPQIIDRTPADFVVQGIFKIRRDQVATLLCCAFDESAPSRFKIVEFVRPPAFAFRAHPVLVLRHLDYPLNEGGSFCIRTDEPGSAVLRLDLGSISSGLNAFAVECPRHFADFLNEKADSFTGDAFLQCCLFGEVIP